MDTLELSRKAGINSTKLRANLHVYSLRDGPWDIYEVGATGAQLTHLTHHLKNIKYAHIRVELLGPFQVAIALKFFLSSFGTYPLLCSLDLTHPLLWIEGP